ncbi:MAG: hypothetical protein PHR68_05395 [Candidatus Gracilibacteria bacterium]|nr:hypothetical protein [Candidatus Gracilibacteria bacterium]
MNTIIDNNKKKIEAIVYVISFLMPFMTLPQIFIIYFNKDVSCLSLTTYSLYLILQIPMLLYMILIKTKPLLINTVLWMIMYSLIIIGILIYR